MVPPYFEMFAMEHGYNRVTANFTHLRVVHVSTEVPGRVIDGADPLRLVSE